VQLQWKQGDNGGAAVKGFALAFKRDSHTADWEDVSLDKRLTTYLLDSLDCGTQYQFKLTGKNNLIFPCFSSIFVIVDTYIYIVYHKYVPPNINFV
jgi:hypothetical protein